MIKFFILAKLKYFFLIGQITCIFLTKVSQQQDINQITNYQDYYFSFKF